MVSISSDPRFKLARTLVSSASSSSGSVGSTTNNNEDDDEDSSPIATAIDIFASLLNECENNTTNAGGDGDGDGKTSCNTALCQYEYANALFRASVLETPFDETEESGGVVEGGGGGDGDKKPAAAVVKSGEAMSQREVMAAAALKRSADAAATSSGDVVGEEEEDSYSSSNKRSKLNEKDGAAEKTAAAAAAGLKTEEDGKNGEEIVQRSDESNQEDAEEEDDDLSLALEMMETSVGILLNYHYHDDDDDDANNGNDTKQKWLLDQLPRILICIGDLHSHRGEYGRAVDAYCRALAYRDKAWNAVKQRASMQVESGDMKSSKEALLTLEALQCQRKMVEINALIVEALLACPSGQDVVCPDEDDESKLNVLVPSKERISYAQSYFQEARLGNDDVLLRIGTMKKKRLGGDLKEEKVDVAYMLQMVVGVGRALSDVLET